MEEGRRGRREEGEDEDGDERKDESKAGNRSTLNDFGAEIVQP